MGGGARPWMCGLIVVVAVAAACAPASQQAPSGGAGAQGSQAGPGSAAGGAAAGGAQGSQAAPGRMKVLNLGLRTVLDGFSIGASATLQGGGIGYIEIHSQGLFTSDKTTGRPIPRLVAEQPTVDNGDFILTSDGKMVATYKLRHDVQWADGAPFTSKDLMLTFAIEQNKSMPVPDATAVSLMESATAPDDYTFVLTWKQPYYLADAIGPLLFWPLPSHTLAADYQTMVVEQNDVQGFMAKPYWTAEFFHIGPFKLTQFNAGDDAVFDAVDQYFLGRPKVDRIVVKQIVDPNAYLANIISGSIDLSLDNALLIEQGVELKSRWDADGGGTVYFATGTTWFVAFQFDQSVADFEPVVLDRTVRQALYQAIDREAYAEAVQAGVQGRAANSLLSPAHPLYPFTKDAWIDRYPYDPNRAVALLEGDGWQRGADGVMVSPTLGRLHIDGRTTEGQDRKLAVVADYWRKIGVDASELIMSGAAIRDRVYRQAYPGMEITARGNEEVVLSRAECSAIPTAANSYSGNNRGHWCNPNFDRVVGLFRAELNEQARGPLIQQAQQLLLDDLPFGLLHYEVSVPVVRRGVTALADDFAGGHDSGIGYGTYSRDAHEWDIVG